MNWNKGYTFKVYGSVVDKTSWRDISRFDIISASIKKSQSSLIESADIEFTNDIGGEVWVRIWIDTIQGGESLHVPVFTGIATTPEVVKNGSLNSRKMQCYSVLKPAEDILLPRGWYVSAGVSGGNAINMLFEDIDAPVEISPYSPALADYIIAEDGESKLSMAEKILTAINWRMKITGDGIIHVLPKPIEESIVLDSAENDSIEPKIKIVRDWFECPNVYRAVIDEMSAIARDDSEESELSTVNRGREIWQEEVNCKLNDSESLADYAKRKLREAQKVSAVISYDRRFNPDVTVGDLALISYPAQDINGLFEISSQSIKLDKSINVSEEVQSI